jgi:dihydrofolate reductase
MRKLIAAVFLSLDGVMQAPGGPDEDRDGGFAHGGWTVPFFDNAVGEAMTNIFDRPFDLLLGRKTYDIFAAHWPAAEHGDDADIARRFNAARKYVATGSKAPLGWHNSVAISAPAVDVAQLKRQAGPDLLLQGSSMLAQTLLANHLIDEFHLVTFPIVLGSGKRLFSAGTEPRTLDLIGSRSSPLGVTIRAYRLGGAVGTGSFALERAAA